MTNRAAKLLHRVVKRVAPKRLIEPPCVPEKRCPSSEDRANWISTLLFLWPASIVRTASLRRLELEDFPLLSTNRTNEAITITLRRNWEHYISTKSRWPLLRAIEKTRRFDIWLALILDVGSTTIDFADIVVLYFLYRYLHDAKTAYNAGTEPPSYARGIIWTTILTITHTIVSVQKVHARYRSQMLGAEIKTALISLISTKSFTVDNDAPITAKSRRTTASSAEKHAPAAGTEDLYDPERTWTRAAVLNLLGIHTDRVANLVTAVIILTRIVIAPLLALAIWAWLMGWIAVPMFAAFLTCVVLGIVSASHTFRYRRKANSITDDRVNEITGLFEGMRLIKLFGWESYFHDRVTQHRQREYVCNQKLSFWYAVQLLFKAHGIIVAPLVGYAIYASRNTLSGGNSPALVLVGVTFMMLDRNSWEVIVAFLDLINAYPASIRVQSYLLADDMHQATSLTTNNPELAVYLSSAKFAWHREPGAGFEDHEKMSPHADALPICPKTALAPAETAELASETAPPETELLESALSETSKPSINMGFDLELLPITLEIPAGQLLAIVGPSQAGKTSLLQGLIGGMHLLAGTCEIDRQPSYCSQEPFIQSATVRDNILFGQTYDELLYNSVIGACALPQDLEGLVNKDLSALGEMGVNFSGGQKARISLARTVYQCLADKRRVILLDDPLSAVDSETSAVLLDETVFGLLKEKTRVLVTHQLQVLSRCDRILYMREGRIAADGTLEELTKITDFSAFMDHQEQSLGHIAIDDLKWKSHLEKKDSRAEDRQENPVEEEERADYNVPLKLYFRLVPTLRDKVEALSLTALLIFSQVLYCLTNLQLAWWTSDEYNLSLGANIGLYIGLGLVTNWTWTAYAWLAPRYLIRQGKQIHEDALAGVLRAPISFSFANPQGRLINRFTHDVAELDSSFPFLYWSASLILACNLGQCGLAVAFVPTLSGLLLVYLVSGVLIFLAYKRSPLETKRLSVNLASKYMALVNESLQGRETISLANYQSDFIATLASHIDEFNSIHFLSFAAFGSATLANCLSFTFIMFCSGFLLVQQRFTHDASILVLVFAMFTMVASLMQEYLTAVSSCQQGVNALERLTHYALDLPNEGERTKRKKINREKAWPSGGAITFENVHLQYSPMAPMALNNISLDIKAGEKLGIVGRTGGGKSTLLMAILRLFPLAKGRILIDGRDITEVELDDIRHAVSTIPQDPILFPGTVRFNLDPTGEVSDYDLYATLEKVQLVGPDAEGEEGNLTLDTRVTSGGSNFSSGQVQLVSLARALVKKARITVIDEATSNVDVVKDMALQAMIRRVFADCTVITIAHRLRTVLGYDRLAVMDEGQIIELGAPRELFLRSDGSFRSFCDQAGIKLDDFDG